MRGEAVTEDRQAPDRSFTTTEHSDGPIRLHLVFGEKMEIIPIPDKQWMRILAGALERLQHRR